MHLAICAKPPKPTCGTVKRCYLYTGCNQCVIGKFEKFLYLSRIVSARVLFHTLVLFVEFLHRRSGPMSNTKQTHSCLLALIRPTAPVDAVILEKERRQSQEVKRTMAKLYRYWFLLNHFLFRSVDDFR